MLVWGLTCSRDPALNFSLVSGETYKHPMGACFVHLSAFFFAHSISILS